MSISADLWTFCSLKFNQARNQNEKNQMEKISEKERDGPYSADMMLLLLFLFNL